MAPKILVIDDEPLILMTIEKALVKSGYDVTTTSDPGEFVNALSSEGADLLIVDLHLGGIDTDALIAKATGMAPEAKLLIVSGSVADIKWENYLQKPFKISELRGKVEELLR
jgi:DNA-binding response OmpR family regulator